MDNNSIREILRTKALPFTKAEIEAIMDEELEKNPDEMDTELIDLCLQALTGKAENDGGDNSTETPGTSPKTKIKIKKILLVAAIIVSFMAVSVSAGANLFNINIPEKILKVYNDSFKVNLNQENQTSDLEKVLSEHGFEDLILPQYLYDECEVSGVEVLGEDENRQICIDFKCFDSEIYGSLDIDNNKIEYGFSLGETLANGMFDEYEPLHIKGIDVIVFLKEKTVYINYCVDYIEYEIVLNNCSFDDALMIAQTI